MDDGELLDAYLEQGSETAFRELVSRYAGLVYSTALRQLQNPNHAEDVSQSVFCLLARKAPSLREHPLLVGWLYKTTCFLASDYRRMEMRRRLREEKAAIMLEESTHSETPWDQVSPILDQALNKLPSQDRAVILLRFFQQRPMREIGERLGISEDAAKMRVGRAVEKLRRHFARKGVALSSVALSTLLTQQAVQAVPQQLVASLASLALSTSSATIATAIPASIQTLILMASPKLKTALLVSLFLMALGGATGLILFKAVQYSPSPPPAVEPALASQAAFATQSAADGEKTTTSSTTAALSGPLARLRAALFAPNESRKIRFDNVVEALHELGPDRRAAIPILLDALRTKNMVAVFRAARGLQDLGPDAVEAIPELLRLLETGDLLLLNDELPRVFLSIAPVAEMIPRLLGSIQRPQVPELIAAIAERDPERANTYRQDFESLMDNENAVLRFQAARVLAHYPGQSNPKAIEILAENLNPAGVVDPHYYDPAPLPDSPGSFRHRDDEKFTDFVRRRQAVNALAKAGNASRDALPILEVIASKTDDRELRQATLLAIGKIDSAKRVEFPEVNEVLTAWERSSEVLEKIRAKKADVSDLAMGLDYQNSVGYAAEAIGELPAQEIQTLLPQLKTALGKWGDYDTAQLIKRHDPKWLVEALRLPMAMHNAASSLGELGTAAQYALPELWRILESDSTESPYPIAEAITKIDPTGPKPMFDFEELHPAVEALMNASENAAKPVRDQILNVYTEHGQDLNSVTRGKLLKFVEAIKRVDPQMHGLFVTELLKHNPSLHGAFDMPR